MKDFLYGVAYYPEYEPYERTEKDMEMMKAAGINTIRIAESTWSTWEKNEGEYDFSVLIKTLDAAEKYGMKVIIGTPTYAVPAWLVKKDIDVLATTRNGRGIYGARQIMDITNKTYRTAAEKLIRRLMEVARPYKCVIGFQLDNETKHYGNMGQGVQESFKEYLKEKFGTLENLNKAYGFAYWSNLVGDWDDLPDVRGTINGSYASEFERYTRRLASEFLLWQRNIIDEYRRGDQFVTHNLDFEWKQDELAPFGYSFGVQSGINHLEASKALTVSGCDIYHPTQDDLTGMEIAYGGDSIRSLKDEPYLVLETQAQAFRYWTPYPGQLLLQAMSHVASGASGIEYWHWHSIHNSCETYWKGVLSHDLEENRIYREVSDIGKRLKELSPKLSGIKKNNTVALVVDNLSQTALKYFPIGDSPEGRYGEKLTYNEVVMEYYRALYEQNIECDVIDVMALPEKIDKYKMLVAPALYCASDSTVMLLKRFVENGGTLISSFKSFFTDENVKVRSDRQPYGMTEVFGGYYQEFTRPGQTCLRDKKVTVWQELLILDGAKSAEHYQHKYWGEYAAILRNDYGRGHAVYIGCSCHMSILKDELRKAAVQSGLTLVKAEFPIIIRCLENDKGQQLVFIFNYSDTEMKAACPFEKLKLLDGDEEYYQGDEIALGEWAVKIFIR